MLFEGALHDVVLAIRSKDVFVDVMGNMFVSNNQIRRVKQKPEEQNAEGEEQVTLQTLAPCGIEILANQVHEESRSR